MHMLLKLNVGTAIFKYLYKSFCILNFFFRISLRIKGYYRKLNSIFLSMFYKLYKSIDLGMI